MKESGEDTARYCWVGCSLRKQHLIEYLLYAQNFTYDELCLPRTQLLVTVILSLSLGTFHASPNSRSFYSCVGKGVTLAGAGLPAKQTLPDHWEELGVLHPRSPPPGAGSLSAVDLSFRKRSG